MTTKTISPELRAFLQDWLDWVERGAPDGEPYDRSEGLCIALADYSTGRWGYHAYLEYCREFDRALGSDFRAAPFGKADYCARKIAGTQHQCPKRLAWVRKTLAEAASEED